MGRLDKVESGKGCGVWELVKGVGVRDVGGMWVEAWVCVGG
ncbi:MAG: hypothetical protein QMD08_07695 [Actinomycetota bacterium]|nr:hypothetical protein [Actinomycetota bacterium]